MIKILNVLVFVVGRFKDKKKILHHLTDEDKPNPWRKEGILMYFELKATIKKILTNFFRCKGIINSE